MIHTFWAATASFIFGFQVFGADNTVWSRQALVANALDQSPQILQLREEVRATKLEADNALQFWLPTLDLLAVHGKQGSWPNAPTSPWYSASGLTLNESLYDNGEGYKKSRVANLKKEIADLRYHDLYGRIVLDVNNLYFDNCVAEIQLQNTQKYADQLGKQLKWVNSQFRNGIKTKNDYIRFRAQSERSELEVIKRKRDIQAARAALFTKLGIPDTDQQVVSCVSDQPYRIEQLETGFKPFFPLEKVHEKQKEITDYQTEIVRRKLWPEVLLSANATYGSTNYIETGYSFRDNLASTWNALLTLRWNLWDWGVRRRSIEIENIRGVNVERSVEIEFLAIRKEWQIFLADLEAFKKSYVMTKDLEKIEKDNFSFLESEYRMGRVSYLDLVTALSNYLDAQGKSTESDFDLQKNILKIQYFQGKLRE